MENCFGVWTLSSTLKRSEARTGSSTAMKMDRFLVDSIRSFFIKAPRRRTVSPITKTPIVIFPPEK
jgi:hypothetical protein